MNQEQFTKAFTKQAETCADLAYIEKTLLQLHEIPLSFRKKLKPKIALFLNVKDLNFKQKLFNEIAGLVNDYQMNMKGEYTTYVYD